MAFLLVFLTITLSFLWHIILSLQLVLGTNLNIREGRTLCLHALRRGEVYFGKAHKEREKKIRAINPLEARMQD